ncbi:MAG: DEAD/DEAH box helicase [Bacillota bacterium]
MHSGLPSSGAGAQSWLPRPAPGAGSQSWLPGPAPGAGLLLGVPEPGSPGGGLPLGVLGLPAGGTGTPGPLLPLILMPLPLLLGPPPGPPPPLYPFQEEGARFLAERPAALLCDEMGLGKSVQAIVALRSLLEEGKVRRALVLCPKGLVLDWARKFRRWAPELILCPMTGPARRRHHEWRYPRVQVYVAGYETWREDCEVVQPDFDLVILDEVQRIKNPRTQVAQAVQRIPAPRRWGLSGTPLENRLGELVAIFSYLCPGLIPPGAGPREVREAIAPYVLRRRKAEVLTLPPKEHREVWLDLGPRQREAYEAACSRAREALAVGETGRAQVLTLLTELKQLCNLEPESGESVKLDFILRELPAIQARGEKVLIFSQYPEKTLLPLLPRLMPYGACLFSGVLSQWQREEVVRRFEEEEWPRVLLVSLRAGGVGLTFTRANHVYHFDQWWNPAAAVQAEDRVHRIGQHRPVTVTSLCTRDTVETEIARLLARKRELFNEVVEGLESPRLEGEVLAELLSAHLSGAGGVC